MKKVLRILVIEDSEDDAILVLHKIKQSGYDIDYELIETAEKMQVALKEKKWDIILSDYKMPRFNGLEALALLKESGIDIPFIVISGTIGEEVAVEAMKAGAHDYLMKNNLNRLIPAIERELRESKSRAERKLSEKQLALLNFSLDHVNETALLSDEQGRFLYANYEACRTLGYNREELLSMGMTDIVADYPQKNWQNHVRDLKASGSLIFETSHKTKDGCIFPVEINVSNFEYDGASYILAMSRNISERKRAEEELHRLNRELRAISNCNLTLLRTNDEITLLNEICRIICDEAGYRMAWVGYVETDGTKTLRPVAYAGIEDGYLSEAKISLDDIERGSGPAGMAIKSGKSIYIQDFATNSQFAPWLEIANQRGYRSGFALPLKDGNTKVFGVLMIYSSETNTITSDEIRLMEELTGDLAFGIITMRTREERKRAEEALFTSEERFSKIFRLSPIAIAIFRVDNGCLVDVNDVFVKESGYTRKELIGYTTEELNLYADSEERNTIIQILQEKGSMENYEFKTRNKSGEIHIGLNTTIMISLGGEKHYLSLIQDISERKQAENELRKLSRAVEQSPASIVITNTEGKIEYVNFKFTEITGYTKQEVLGQNPRVLKTDEMTPDYYKEMWKTISSGKEWYGEFHNKKKSGELYWELASISPIFDATGSITHFLAVKEDITERKQTEKELLEAKEKAEESDRLKTSFLCNMSHEIRTPMNAIVGFSDFLCDNDIPSSKKQLFSKIIKERSYDLLRIVEEILDISKIEVGQMQIIDMDVNLENIMYELYEYYKLKITQSDSELFLSINFSLDNQLKNAILKTDGQRLKQILVNLLDNAFKFTKKGLIELGCKIASNSEILFYIKDTGIGIPVDKQEIVFDRFRQAEDLMSARSYGGTGLGLSIVKGLVTLMNGRVWLESKVDIGTTFYFTLPLKLSYKTDDYNPQNKNVDFQMPSWRNKIILIVEDNDANSEYFKVLLTGKYFQVLMAYTGEEALQVLKNNPKIDLVLMDIRLPDTSGLNITRMIKKINPKIIVIAQTAYAFSNDRQDCLDAGCSDYISKPINSQKLITLIDYYLGSG